MENRQTDQIYQEIHKNMQKYPKGKCLESHANRANTLFSAIFL